MSTTSTTLQFLEGSGYNETGNDTLKCLPRNDPGVLILSIIPILAFALNGLVIIAVTLHRSQLKQNNIYLYVYSTLLSNLLFSLLCVYQIFNHYFQFEGDPASLPAPGVQGWWVFRKALLVSFYLIMIANIGALIYAMRAGSYVIAKAASTGGRIGGPNSMKSKQYQRRKAYLLISLSWILPIFLSLLSLANWNCSSECKCLTACYTVEDMDTPERSCSRVWASQSNSYMIVVVVVWAIEILALLFLVSRTFGRSLIIHTDCCNLSTSLNEAQMKYPSVDPLDDAKAVPVSMKQESSDPPTPSDDKNKDVLQQENLSSIGKRISRKSKIGSRKTRAANRRLQRYAKWLRHSSKQLSYLLILFFVCTAPAMICIIVDVSQDTALPPLLSSVMMALPLIYSIIFPIILAKDLAGLKHAIISAVLKCLPGTRTEQHSVTTSSSTCSQ